MRHAWKMVILVVTLTGFSFAQGTTWSERDTIRLLVEQLQELQQKVKALEAKQGTPALALTF